MVDTKYKPKPIYRFNERKTTTKLSPWKEKKINKYMQYYFSVSKYVKAIHMRKGLICVMLIISLILFSLCLIFWEFENTYWSAPLAIAFLVTSILLLIFVLLYTIYSTMFFKTALAEAITKSEHKKLIKKYKDINIAKSLSKNKIKTLYKMSIINKDYLNLLIK